MTEEDLKKAIIKDHDRKNNGWFGYNNCNRQIPILFEYNFDEKKLFFKIKTASELMILE